MSLTTLFLLLGAAGLGGAVIGYVFRLLLVSARKNSIEVEVKQLLLNANVQAQTITAEAESRAK